VSDAQWKVVNWTIKIKSKFQMSEIRRKLVQIHSEGTKPLLGEIVGVGVVQTHLEHHVVADGVKQSSMALFVHHGEPNKTFSLNQRKEVGDHQAMYHFKSCYVHSSWVCINYCRNLHRPLVVIGNLQRPKVFNWPNKMLGYF